MTRARVGLLWAILLTTANPVRAQVAAEGWDVSLDVLNVLTRGNDVHVGDVYTERQVLTGTQAQTRFDYGVDYEPIVTRMGDNISGMFTAVRRRDGWGVGVRAWRSRSTASVRGADQTAPSGPSSDFLTGIRMWDHSVLPVPNETQPSGISPVTFHAASELTNVRVEGFVERLWIQGRALNAAARFGMAHARVESVRSEGQTMAAFVVDIDAGSITTFTNDIRLDSEGEATMTLNGPMLAVVGDSTAGRLRIDWLIGHAALFGTADTSGRWTDVDDITETTVADGSTLTTTTLLNGVLDHDQDDRALVSVVDLQFKASVHVAGPLRIGAGVFSSTWFNLPVAPAFSIPGDWTDLQGTGWRLQQRDVTFLGYAVFAGLAF